MIGARAHQADPSAVDVPLPRHVAIIMDGNGRWARRRGLPRSEGHRRGVEAVRRAVRYAGHRGIEVLTLFSFSSENWNRPEDEIQDLLNLMRFFIRRDLAELKGNNVRVHVIGERVGLPPDILDLIVAAESETASNNGLALNVAFNYGARDEIVRAVRKIAEQVAAGAVAPGEIDAAMLTRFLDTDGMPDPDLVLRTSGEQRISNFLLWQSAYSELVFLPVLWPDFDDESFEAALTEYAGRDRRYGGRRVG